MKKIIFTMLFIFISCHFLYSSEVKDIQHNIQLIDNETIDKIDSKIKETKFLVYPFRELKWPDKEEITKYSNHTIYSKKYIKENGLESFRRVKKDCIYWINEILNKNYIPLDLKNRLIILQYKDPKKSKVVCRYEINGTYIQIIIKIADIDVIITPVNNFYKNNIYDYKKLFSTYFTKKEYSSNYKIKSIHNTFPFYKFDHSNEFFVKHCSKWYCHIVWYINKNSIAISIKKLSGSIIPITGAPWF